MKSRFKNIFSTKKKSRGIISLCLMLALIITSSSFVGCQSTKGSSPEDTAKSFLTGFYGVESNDQLEKIEEAWNKASEATVPPPSGTGIGTIPEVKLKEFREASLSKINAFITTKFGDTLMANKSITKNLNMAKDYNYTTEIKDINLQLMNSNEFDKNYYNYKVTVVITYPKEVIEEQVLEGSLTLIKEDGNWFVEMLKENNSITPNKEFYAFDNVLNNNNLTLNTNPMEFFSAEDLCNEYTKALLGNDASFIFSNTINAANSNTLEENQQIMDSIKIASINVIASEVRDNKAYYELEINVSEPGGSAYGKGKNIRWLYLSSASKGGIKHWMVEGLMSSGKPNEQWWSTIMGG